VPTLSQPFMAIPDLPISQARLHEYLDVWAIDPTRGMALADSLRRCDWASHLAAWKTKQAERADVGVQTRKPFAMTASGIAVISVAGPMMKQVGSMEDGTSTVLVRRQVRAATSDKDVKGIMLLVDSPGGTIAGTADLADDIATATGKKPTSTYYQDLGASAAIWAGTQTGYQSANRTSAIGSIGVYTVVHDLSKMAEQEGVGVFVIASGKYKGLGVPGTKISEELLGELQKRVDGLAVHFVEAVARGRKLSVEAVTAIADGRTFSAEEAAALKLIDRVESLDEAMVALERRIGGVSQGRKNMSDTQISAPVAASLEQIEAACPGASSEFVLGQLKAKATTEQAQTAFIKSLAEAKAASDEKAKAAEERAAAAESKAKAAEPAKDGKKPVGHDPLREQGKGSNETDASDPVAKFDAMVAEKVAAGMPKHEAYRAVCRDNDELRAAVVEAHNLKIKSA